jgi:hypothetical protein
MAFPLPYPRLYNARTVRVYSHDSIVADIDLGFGAHVHRRVFIAGVPARVQMGVKNEAYHCLVVLLGGKNLLLEVSATPSDQPFCAKVYLDERVHGSPVGMTCPSGATVSPDNLRLDVGAYYVWLGQRGYDLGVLKETLNGRRSAA